MKLKFTTESLPEAVRNLFKQNNYIVDGPLQINGAEIDLIARPIQDAFGSTIYIEATIEYVDNTKYGKDLTKLAMLREHDPDCKTLIVSSEGFSLPVKERAKKTRIETLTYDELFQRFEKFGPYLDRVLDTGSLAQELTQLNAIYEEPEFDDKIGNEKALSYLDKWSSDADQKNKNWLIVVGEYGTGKTALTKILQHKWSVEHKENPAKPIPFRVELRDFSRQFDAKGLLHHFLDYNNLGHLPIDFVLGLIRSQRIILILDGYDEMAQYMHARERRACLEALAELSADGAKGIITSRPNYFSEAEELQVFEILYRSISSDLKVSKETEKILEKEKQLEAISKIRT